MRLWIVSILMTLLLMPGRSGAQTKLSAKWEELTAGDFKEAIAKSQGTCLLPFGILEKHGPHLPIGTDLLNARYVAEHAAEEEYAIIFPEYFAGQIFEAKHEPGTVAYSPELQLRLLQETTDEMARNGCKKVVIVNAHGGNEYLLPYFAQSQLYKPHDYVVYVQWGHESGKKAGTEKPGPDVSHRRNGDLPSDGHPPEPWYTWIELEVNQAQSKSASSSRRVCSQASGGTRDFLTTIPVTGLSRRKS